jgi:conflict system STAND superfamily ATPase
MGIFLDLVEVSLHDDARGGTRRTVARRELLDQHPERARLTEELVDARVLATSAADRAGESVEVVDVIHETLLTNWTRLRSAIHEQLEFLQRRERLRLAAAEWERNGRRDEYLLRGARLAEALELQIAVSWSASRRFSSWTSARAR